MQKKLNIFIILILIAAVLTGCNKKKNENHSQKEAKIPVEAAYVKKGDIHAFYTGTASLEPEKEALILTKSSGTVINIFAEEGDVVKEGDLLAKIDDKEMKLTLKQAEINLKKMENDLERTKKLYEKNFISEEQFEAVKFEYESQKNLYEQAKLNLENTEITASISGTVTKRYLKKGNTASFSEPAYHIANMEKLHAVLHVPEGELSKLKPEQTARLTADALPNMDFYGDILRINPVIDPSTGTFKVTVQVKDPNNNLKPGMFSRISIVYDVHKQALLIPKDAVISEDRENLVFKAQDSVAVKLAVKTGYTNTDNIEILEGLKEGDTVITMGASALKDSSKIEIININDNKDTQFKTVASQ